MNVGEMKSKLADINHLKNCVVQVSSWNLNSYNVGEIRTSDEMNDEMHCSLLEDMGLPPGVPGNATFGPDPNDPPMDIYAEDLEPNQLIIRINDNDGSFPIMSAQQFLEIISTYPDDLQLGIMDVDGMIDPIESILDQYNQILLMGATGMKDYIYHMERFLKEHTKAITQ